MGPGAGGGGDVAAEACAGASAASSGVGAGGARGVLEKADRSGGGGTSSADSGAAPGAGSVSRAASIRARLADSWMKIRAPRVRAPRSPATTGQGELAMPTRGSGSFIPARGLPDEDEGGGLIGRPLWMKWRLILKRLAWLAQPPGQRSSRS